NTITAVMVGETHTQTLDFADYESLFPLDMLNLLSIATGVRVGAPWIEFRDEAGEIVRRVHICFGNSIYQRGHAVVLDYGGNAIGNLLTRALASPEGTSKYSRVATTHAINASTKMNGMESRFISLVRGFETLCRHNGLDKQDLSAILNPAQR